MPVYKDCQNIKSVIDNTINILRQIQIKNSRYD